MEAMLRRRVFRAFVSILLIFFMSGCIEIQQALLGVVRDQVIGGSRPGSAAPVDSSDNNSGALLPVVTLSVSNPTPQLNEEVLLQCTLLSGSTEGVTFDFQPADGRLFIDRTAGRATFIVEATDSGVATSFTCTATNQDGTSRPSNAQVVVPTF